MSRVMRSGAIFMVFWKGPTNITYKGEIVGREIYCKYKCTSVIKLWRNVERTKRLFVSGGFRWFKTFTMYEFQRDTIDDLIGGHRTNSKYAALDAVNRKKFLQEISAAYKVALGDKKYFITKRETTACYAFK